VIDAHQNHRIERKNLHTQFRPALKAPIYQTQHLRSCRFEFCHNNKYCTPLPEQKNVATHVVQVFSYFFVWQHTTDKRNHAYEVSDVFRA